LPSVSPEGAKSTAVARAGAPQVAVASGWIALLFGAAAVCRLLDWGLLVGLLAVAAASSSFGQLRTRAPAGNELAQYCAPQHESTDAPKFYCRSEV